MAETFVQVPLDGIGKQIAAYLDASGYYRQTVVWGDPSSGGTIAAAVKAANVAPATSVDAAGTVVLRPDSVTTVTGGNKPVGPASISAMQSTIGTSAELIIAARTGGVGTGRCTLTLKNTGTYAVAIGSSTGVTTVTGYILNPGDSFSFDTAAAVYGISSGAGNVVCVMETF